MAKRKEAGGAFGAPGGAEAGPALAPAARLSGDFRTNVRAGDGRRRPGIEQSNTRNVMETRTKVLFRDSTFGLLRRVWTLCDSCKRTGFLVYAVLKISSGWIREELP